jgi:hypothetical protein
LSLFICALAISFSSFRLRNNPFLHFSKLEREILDARHTATTSPTCYPSAHLGPDSCVLSEYLSNTSPDGHHAIGYVGNSKYVLPLHKLSIVPGHVTRRLAICQTETAVNSLDVYVQCYMPKYKIAGLFGSMLLSKYISIVANKMDKNKFKPFKPVVYQCKIQ